mmetsp:Transcript_7793/g.12233  ORF Transcript_7793/g.12233 Transcript_7793/m.12233 type:complete len:307 (+) Transcript_7793:931-1851(+)
MRGWRVLVLPERRLSDATLPRRLQEGSTRLRQIAELRQHLGRVDCASTVHPRRAPLPGQPLRQRGSTGRESRRAVVTHSRRARDCVSRAARAVVARRTEGAVQAVAGPAPLRHVSCRTVEALVRVAREGHARFADVACAAGLARPVRLGVAWRRLVQARSADTGAVRERARVCIACYPRPSGVLVRRDRAVQKLAEGRAAERSWVAEILSGRGLVTAELEPPVHEVGDLFRGTLLVPHAQLRHESAERLVCFEAALGIPVLLLTQHQILCTTPLRCNPEAIGFSCNHRCRLCRLLHAIEVELVLST